MSQERTSIRRANGDLLAERRKLIGITQGDLADALDVTRDVVSNYELGRQEVFMDHLFAMAEILGFEPEYLLADIETIGTNAVRSIAPDAAPLSEQKLYRLMIAKPGDYLASHEREAPKS